MTSCMRYQFRLPKRDEHALEEAAAAAGIPANLMAKQIVQAALAKDPIRPELLAEDLLFIRAGIEQLFRRSGRDGELDEAVRDVRTRRADLDEAIGLGGAR